ncbi:YdiU family protein [Alphaproteobacteria bacterium]|nr:YdiU family protein [Alphaproteobacteria bacterium]
MKINPNFDKIQDPEYVDFNFDNSFARELEGFFVPCKPSTVPEPSLLIFNQPLAEKLSLDTSALQGPLGAEIFSGNRLPHGAIPLAQAYAGHQFGNFSPQLGDGRALLLGEIIDKRGERQDFQLKGSGRTPFSRSGDGKAALGPVLREYLISEAMHALGVPTTRSLAAVSTGEKVFREIALPGAVLTRISTSHLRVGTFEFFAARGQTDMVRRLANYAISRHYPMAHDADNTYLEFFKSVTSAQIKLVAHWMSIGFIHGVMNTDNTTISGQTIDYGPCAFMDTFSPKTVFSSIDLRGRYAYGNQPSILMWNLVRLAETLAPLVHTDKDHAVELLTEEAKNFKSAYNDIWLTHMRAKIGLNTEENGDSDLIQDLLNAMQEGEADFTLTFRRLSNAMRGDNTAVRKQFINSAQYDLWECEWHARLEREPASAEARATAMDKVNPIYIPRNHKVEEALSMAINNGNLSAFENILSAVSAPFEEVSGRESYTEPAPKTSVPYQTFCGT